MEYEDFEYENTAIVVHIEGDNHPEEMTRQEFRCFAELAKREGIKYKRTK